MSRSATLTLLLTITVFGEVPAQASSHKVVLREEAARVLPNGFSLAGLGVGAHGELLAWAREPNRVLQLGDGLVPERSWTLPDSLRPLAVSSGPAGIEVVTADPPGLYYFDTEGGREGATRRVGVEGMLLAATRGREGWYLLSEANTGEVTVRHRTRPGSAVVERYGALTPDEQDGVWLTMTIYPFEAQQLRHDWTEGLVLRPPAQVLDSMLAAAAQPNFAMWASLPLVVLNCGYLQTIADLAEDRRLIVIYDQDGRVISHLTLDVPLGLTRGAADRSRVYGARRTGSVEIVAYSYRWTFESGHSSPTENRGRSSSGPKSGQCSQGH